VPGLTAWLADEAAKLGCWIYDGAHLMYGTWPVEPRCPEDLHAQAIPKERLPLDEAWRRFDGYVAPVLAASGFTPGAERWFALPGARTDTYVGFSAIRDTYRDERFTWRVGAWLMVSIPEVEAAIGKLDLPISRLLRVRCKDVAAQDRAADLRLRAGWSLCHERCIELDAADFAHDVDTALRPVWERYRTIAGLDELFNADLYPNQVGFRAKQLPPGTNPATDWARVAFVAAALAIRAGRDDRSCLEIYREYLATSSHPNATALLARYDRFLQS